MPKPHDQSHGESDEGRSQESVRDAAVMLKTGYWAAKTPKHIEIRRFRSERHGQGSVSGPAIESRAAQACAGEEMSDGFHKTKQSSENIAAEHRGCGPAFGRDTQFL